MDREVVEHATDDSSGIALCGRAIVVEQGVIGEGC
jgi:hypothetical protein